MMHFSIVLLALFSNYICNGAYGSLRHTRSISRGTNKMNKRYSGRRRMLKDSSSDGNGDNREKVEDKDKDKKEKEKEKKQPTTPDTNRQSPTTPETKKTRASAPTRKKRIAGVPPGAISFPPIASPKQTPGRFSSDPTQTPTKRPKQARNTEPTKNPTPAPTQPPTKRPKKNPTERPTFAPTLAPTLRPTISGIILSDTNLTAFAQILSETNLIGKMNETGKFTVFAPDNEAFAENEFMTKYENDGWLLHLKEITLYHMMDNDHSAFNASVDGIDFMSLNRKAFTWNSNPPQINNYINVTTSDIEASNGIINIIDSVMVPSSLDLDIVANGVKLSRKSEVSYSFYTLLGLTVQAGLTETLSSASPITLLAPTDRAFTAVDSGLIQFLLRPTNRDYLKRVLQYHVLEYNAYSTYLVSGLHPSLEGTSVNIAVTNESIVIDGIASIIESDVLAKNGVIHVIDSLLVPQSVSDAYENAKTYL